jgi:GNAT superfamily N-acetyltransferase
MSALEFRRYDASTVLSATATVEAVFRGAYIQALEEGDPFGTPEAFMTRFASYARNPGIDLVAAVENGEPVGQAWGWPLTANNRWWEGLAAEPEPGFTNENGTRTFALSEIMVIREHTGQGIAHALHDELLRGRCEQRATLLVRPANTTAYTAYARWGWRKASQLRPHWPGSPLFDVLMLPLPLQPTG